MTEKMSYKDAGVDVDAGNRAVELIKANIKSTYRPGVLGDIGAFGGFFQLDIKKYREPVLVSGTDGVGTKLKIAFAMDKHDTVGIDCVAMCANDILVHGAEPLFFLDYVAVGRLIPEKVKDIVSGVAEGCRLAGCALIGGETAEMPGLYEENEYDLAGFAVGVVEKGCIIDGSRIREGDVVIGLTSSGLHSNGYSLARKALLEKEGLALSKYIAELGKTLGEEMLTPTRIYVKDIRRLSGFDIHGMAHITGGGIIENLPRILPSVLEFDIYKNSWEVPPIFKMIQKAGNVDEMEMYRTFNMGIGYVIVTPENQADGILSAINKPLGNENQTSAGRDNRSDDTLDMEDTKAIIIGRVASGKGEVVLC
ncbi:MAG: phosphoribosylformylglycinamidine cyclo-ligase [Tepidanaerobacteraceae bacterium]|nr:phosphoribosylformylglycinamidine cyclo-ligase [Tepidanaerobacteraceae bacterium]